MRKYSKICPSLWTGKTGRTLRGNLEAMLVRDYLLTAPMASMSGVYYCSIYYICADLGLAPQAVNQALQFLVSIGFCFYDWNTEWVFVKNMARFQVGQELKPADKRVVHLRKDVEQMPEPFKSMFVDEYNDVFCLDYQIETEVPQTLNLFEVPSKLLLSQEQEQKQAQYQKQKQEQAQDCTRVVDISDCLIGQDVNENELMTLDAMIEVAKCNGIQLHPTDKLKKIALAKTITLKLFSESIKRCQGMKKDSGYLVGILMSVVEGNLISKSNPNVVTAANITETQALEFAKRLADDPPFASRFLHYREETNEFISRISKELKQSKQFEEFSPYLMKLHLIDQGV